MQKVEGSNPFSRFHVNPLHVAGSAFGRGIQNQLEPPPHIAFISGTNSN
jgi:hypothetical protein